MSQSRVTVKPTFISGQRQRRRVSEPLGRNAAGFHSSRFTEKSGRISVMAPPISLGTLQCRFYFNHVKRCIFCGAHLPILIMEARCTSSEPGSSNSVSTCYLARRKQHLYLYPGPKWCCLTLQHLRQASRGNLASSPITAELVAAGAGGGLYARYRDQLLLQKSTAAAIVGAAVRSDQVKCRETKPRGYGPHPSLPRAMICQNHLFTHVTGTHGT